MLLLLLFILRNCETVRNVRLVQGIICCWYGAGMYATKRRDGREERWEGEHEKNLNRLIVMCIT